MLTVLPSTAVGSLPSGLAARERGVDPAVTAAMTREFFAELPYIVELPARGPGADMVGRIAALLAQVSGDLSVSSVPSGWRRSRGPGADTERALGWWTQDLDALAEVYHDYRGALKLQLCGPLTFSRYVEDAAGEPSLRDAGFARDATSAFAEAALSHLAHVQRLIPGAELVLQIDEPALHDVVTGGVSTASGYARVRSMPQGEAVALFSSLLSRLRTQCEQTGTKLRGLWLHDCGSGSRLGLALAAGFDAVSIDLSRPLTADEVEACGAMLDSAHRLVLGVLSPADWALPEAAMRERAIARSEWLRHRLSLDEHAWAAQVTLAPNCGLASASAAQARSVLQAVCRAGRSVAGDTIAVDEAGR